MMSRLIFPLFSVWSIAAYIHLLHCLYIFKIVSSRLLIFVLFLPVLLFEFLFGLNFPYPMQIADTSDGWIFYFICRSLFWFISFVVWVYFMTFVSKKAIVIKWFVTKFYQWLWLVCRGEGWVTLIPLILWLALYYWITVEMGTLRLFMSLIIPILLLFALMFHLYIFGGRGGLKRKKILLQEGVEKDFEIKKIGPHTVPKHPRGIYYDEKGDALFMMFGRTYGKNEQYPTIIRRDMKTGRMHSFISRNIRRISFDENSRSVFVAPWYEDVYFELSMDELTILKECPSQMEGIVQTWEPMDIVKDVSENRVYIGNDAEQVLISYNLDTRKVERILNLLEDGVVKSGGPVWNILQSKKTRKLYFSSGPGKRRFYDNHLFEVDPDSMTIVKQRKFFDIVATALEIDDEKNLIYYQNGGFKQLHEIDMETFEIKQTFKGEGHARRIRLDKKRNCLYVLGYFSGTVFPIDLDTGKRLWTIHVGGLPHGMHLHEDTLWVNSMSGVLRLDLNKIWDDSANAKPQT